MHTGLPSGQEAKLETGGFETTDMGEFYINDYQIGLLNLASPNPLTGRIGSTGIDGAAVCSASLTLLSL